MMVLALMLMVMTSTNMPVTRICQVFSVQRRPGNVGESAQWAGIRVWLTAKPTACAKRECYGGGAYVRQSSPDSQHRA